MAFRDGDYELQELEYQPFCAICLIAFIASCGAILSVLHSFFLPFAIAAAVFALYAVVSAEARSERPRGIIFGYLGLFLATFLSASTLTYKQLEDRRLFSLAREYAEDWLQLVQQRQVQLPYALSLEIIERPSFDVDLIKFYRELSDERRVKFDAYKVIEPELSMRRAGPECSLQWLENVKRISPTPLNQLFVLKYQLNWSGRDQTIGDLLPENQDLPKDRPWILHVTMRRIEALPPLGPQWIMQSVDCLEPRYIRKLPELDRVE